MYNLQQQEYRMIANLASNYYFLYRT